MKLILATVVAAVAATSLSVAKAQDDVVPLQHGAYATLAAGMNIPSGGDALDLGRTPPNIKFRFHDGVAVSLSGGYKWDPGFRTEVEVSYRGNSAKDFNTIATPLSGHQTDLSFMGNLIYDINTRTRFTPYLGGGVGVAMLWWKNFATAGSGQIIDNGASSTKLAFQAIVGVAYALGPDFEGTLDFRYKGSNGHSFPGVLPVDTITGYKARSMSAMVGFRYAFDTQPQTRTRR
jgi:opacity protein-like surface antigen